VERRAPDGESALAAALDYARLLATTTGPRAVAATKRQLADDRLRLDVGASIEDSKRLLDAAMRTAEHREGIAALRGRRSPRFGT
jgi:enoyl-CoA hydratase/carnithine racemase